MKFMFCEVFRPMTTARTFAHLRAFTRGIHGTSAGRPPDVRWNYQKFNQHNNQQKCLERQAINGIFNQLDNQQLTSKHKRLQGAK